MCLGLPLGLPDCPFLNGIVYLLAYQTSFGPGKHLRQLPKQITPTLNPKGFTLLNRNISQKVLPSAS
jgi:hypothetical protein